MWIVSLVFGILGLFFKGITATTKGAVGLQRKNLLAPAVIIITGGFFGLMLVYGAYYSDLFVIFKGLLVLIGIFIGLLSCGFGYALIMKQKYEEHEKYNPDEPNPYERFFKKKKPKSAQPPKVSGVIFGRKDGEIITKSEQRDGHILVVGGVGSGKSSCIAIPTMRAWNESVFAIDIKGELYDKSKNYRPNAKIFNPLDDKSFGYNPYFDLRTSRNPTQEASPFF